MELKEILTNVSIIIGIFIGLVTIFEKMSNTEILSWIKKNIWVTVILMLILDGMLIYYYVKGLTNISISIVSCLVIWIWSISMLIEARKELSEQSIWKFVALLVLICIVSSYFAIVFPIYFLFVSLGICLIIIFMLWIGR
jgi:hypothetical protein